MPGQLIVSGRQEYVVCDSMEAVSVREVAIRHLASIAIPGLRC